MVGIPAFKAATVGQPGNAGAVNQFLVPHDGTLVYNSATLQANQSTGSGNYTSSQGQYMSQQFATAAGQTTISEIWLQISAVGGSAITNNIDELIVSVYADDSGEPTGSPLGSVSMTETAVYASGFWVILPAVITGLTASTTYHLVTSPAGTASSYYAWQHSNQVSGASLSPDLVAWTDQAFGFMFRIYDGSTTGGSRWQFLLEDNATHWQEWTYTGNLVTTATEYTVDQTGLGNTQYTRNLTYSGSLLTGIN